MRQFAELLHLFIQGFVKVHEAELVVIAAARPDAADDRADPLAEDLLELVAHPFHRPETVALWRFDVLVESEKEADLREVLVECQGLVQVGEIKLQGADHAALVVPGRPRVGRHGPDRDAMREHRVPDLAQVTECSAIAGVQIGPVAGRPRGLAAEHDVVNLNLQGAEAGLFADMHAYLVVVQAGFGPAAFRFQPDEFRFTRGDHLRAVVGQQCVGDVTGVAGHKKPAHPNGYPRGGVLAAAERDSQRQFPIREVGGAQGRGLQGADDRVDGGRSPWFQLMRQGKWGERIVRSYFPHQRLRFVHLPGPVPMACGQFRPELVVLPEFFDRPGSKRRELTLLRLRVFLGPLPDVPFDRRDQAIQLVQASTPPRQRLLQFLGTAAGYARLNRQDGFRIGGKDAHEFNLIDEYETIGLRRHCCYRHVPRFRAVQRHDHLNAAASSLVRFGHARGLSLPDRYVVLVVQTAIDP